MSTYRVVARRTGEWWALEVPDLPGVFSQVKRLDQADGAVREAIALMLDAEPDGFAVEIEPVLSDEARGALDAVREAQEATRSAAERERQAMQRAAVVLTENLSQRDAGRLLGVSFQRVSQLLKEGSASVNPATPPQETVERPRRESGRGSKDRRPGKASGRTRTAA